MNFKYIIFDGETGFDGIIFPPCMEHSIMRAKFADWEVLSAGFVKITTVPNKNSCWESRISCYGVSTSLKIAAKEGDEKAFKWLVG